VSDWYPKTGCPRAADYFTGLSGSTRGVAQKRLDA
jgi:hypothetical protein